MTDNDDNDDDIYECYANLFDDHNKLEKKYDKLVIQFKKQKYHNRKVNRRKYNLAREEAAKTDVIKDLRNKSRERINNLNSQLKDKTEETSNLQEECAYWIQERRYTHQKFLASLAFGIISSVAYIITLKGVEPCICE